MASTTGYSSTPLAKKLGIKEGFAIRLVNPPLNYFKLFDDWPEKVSVEKDDTGKKDFIHFFTVNRRGCYLGFVAKEGF